MRFASRKSLITILGVNKHEQTIRTRFAKSCYQLNSQWKKQDNITDKATNFIYNATTLEKCLSEIRRTGVDKNYALHRWYNFQTSIYCEEIFCDYGAEAEADRYNHDVDIYIDRIPFDVKLTVYPAKLASRPYDLTRRGGKNSMITWYYENQSQQNRKQLLNRLYVVCDGATHQETLLLKSDFELIRTKIKAFMENAKKEGVNRIVIKDGGKEFPLQCEIIYIKK